jgi:hypothetical protein
MTILSKERAACGVGIVLLASAFSVAAYAQTRFVDPQTLNPRARAHALRSPLGDTDPWGRPASAGCTWSRMQVPTAQGLRWVAMEECNPDMWR